MSPADEIPFKAEPGVASRSDGERQRAATRRSLATALDTVNRSIDSPEHRRFAGRTTWG